jgi:di/tricarboxylate transporter
VEVPKEETEGSSAFAYFQKVYGLSPEIFELGVSPYSRAVDVRIDELEARHDVRIVGTHFKGRLRLSPPGDVCVEGPAILAVMGSAEEITEFAGAYGLLLRPNLEHFAEALGRATSGISEVVIPPYSKHLGETLSDLRLRKRFGISVLAVHRGESSIRSGLADLPLQAGDTLVCHSTWEALARLDQDRNYVVVTSDYPHEDLRPQKFADAIFFLIVAMGLVLFVDIPLGLSLMAGALGMVMTGVLSMDEAYQSISWKTVFLLAGLFPLGKMVANSGAGAWIAYQAATLLGGMPVWVMQGAFVALATAFSLIMSNVGATVLLVPLAIQFALATGTDPAQFALLVALGACNSFFIPTNQVNALIMAPGGYKVRDFTRAGGIMTLLFIVVLVAMIDLFF